MSKEPRYLNCPNCGMEIGDFCDDCDNIFLSYAQGMHTRAKMLIVQNKKIIQELEELKKVLNEKK